MRACLRLHAAQQLCQSRARRPGASAKDAWCRRRALQSLAGGSRITTLNLSSNNIGDAGAKALAEMLKVGCRLGNSQ